MNVHSIDETGAPTNVHSTDEIGAPTNVHSRDESGTPTTVCSIDEIGASTNVHTCQPIHFTSIKFKKIIILGGYGHTGKWIQENTIFMRCCCFKLSKKMKNCQMSSQ